MLVETTALEPRFGCMLLCLPEQDLRNTMQKGQKPHLAKEDNRLYANTVSEANRTQGNLAALTNSPCIDKSLEAT
eukprot:6119254-Amphidinium_carterae.1